MSSARELALTGAGAPRATAAGEATAAPRRRRAGPGWLPAVTATVAGLVAGGYRLGVPSPWRDEAATVDAAQRSVPQIFALLAHQDAVNGAYYLLMHPVILLLGSSLAAIRAPSVLAMAVAAGFTAALGRRLAAQAGLPFPAVTGLLAGLLVAAAPLVTSYAQDARPYGIVTMLATVASYLLVRSLADRRWRWWAGYGAAAVLAGHELLRDAVLYLPSRRRILSMSYPGAFRRLRDIALARSPAASATLAGIEVSPAVLRHRFAGVQRVWVVTIRDVRRPPPDSRTDRVKIALIGQLRLAGRWHAGAVMLSLYTRNAGPAGP